MNWHPVLEAVLYLLLLTAGVLALHVKDLLVASVTLTAFSFTAALLMLSMGAVDVAFTESVVGAGIVGVFYVLALFHTSRRSMD